MGVRATKSELVNSQSNSRSEIPTSTVTNAEKSIGINPNSTTKISDAEPQKVGVVDEDCSSTVSLNQQVCPSLNSDSAIDNQGSTAATAQVVIRAPGSSLGKVLHYYCPEPGCGLQFKKWGNCLQHFLRAKHCKQFFTTNPVSGQKKMNSGQRKQCVVTV